VKRARFLVIFGFFVFLIQALFTPGDVVLLKPIPDTSPILPGIISITMEGVILGLEMTLRFLVIVLASFWFVAITDPNKFAYSLMQLGLPYRYGFMLVTSLRLLPQFEIESNTVHNAQLARGIKLEKHGFRGLYNHVRYTLRPLIISALQRAEVMARSMEGRGFGLYKSRTFVDHARITKKDIAIASACILITLFIIISMMLVANQNEVVEFLLSTGN
jgi:energy-coupling factor transport system permease protein